MSPHMLRRFVLILIILEYIYIICVEVINEIGKECLNPYYTGIHLHNLEEDGSIVPFVLILIILEYIYIIWKKTDQSFRLS